MALINLFSVYTSTWSKRAGDIYCVPHRFNYPIQTFFNRCFIIIDDLWATSVWDVVSRAFPEGNHGSKIPVIFPEGNPVL